MFFFSKSVTDTIQPILGPLMRLASTSLQDASKEVLSAHDQCEVRSMFVFGDLVRRLKVATPLKGI